MIRRYAVIATVVLVAVLGALAWNNSRELPAPAEAPGETGPGPAPADPGLVWSVPKGWVSEIPGGMRVATYIVPGAAGASNAECAVYYFGPGQGGGVDANLERWIGEFESHEKQDLRRREVRGMKLATLEVRGTFMGHTMSTGAEAGSQPGWGLLGAILEGPNGNLFFKLTGPAKTLDAASRPFNAMLSSIRPSEAAAD